MIHPPDGYYKGKTYNNKMGSKVSKSKKGRIYITNGLNDKLIYPNQFEEYSNMGYVKGRTFSRKPNKIY